MSEPAEKLRKQILHDAEVQAQKILEEARKQAEKILDGARQAAEQEAKEALSKARDEAEAMRRRLVSKELQASRIRLLEKKNQLLDQAISQAWDKVRSLKDSEGQYASLLKDLVEEGLESLDSKVKLVAVPKEDLKSISGSKSWRSDEEVRMVEDPRVGESQGVIVSTEDGRVSFDNRLSSRLERVERQILSEASRILFGEQ